MRELVTPSGGYAYQHDGCISFPAGGSNYRPDYIYDIARGPDGKYYLLGSGSAGSPPPITEWVSTDGLAFSTTGKTWAVACPSLNSDPGAVETDCNVPPSATACFVADGHYVRDQTGVIVTPHIILGDVGTNLGAVDGSWHLYYWADAGAPLPATWFDTANHVAYAPSCPPPYVVVAGQPSYQGNFDGFHTDLQSASGWAWEWYQPTTSTSVDVYADGSLFATIPANIYRADLGQPADPTHYYYGGGIHGWNWPVTSWYRDGVSHSIDMRYAGTGTSLPNSPMQYKIAAPAGITVSPASLTGGSSSTATITLTQAPPSGGLTVTLSTADPAATIPATSSISGLSGNVSITTVAVAGVTPVTVRASAGSVTKSAVLTINPSSATYAGSFDNATCDYIWGWAWNPSFPTTPIYVDIKEGSTVIASRVPANIYRAGLGGNGVHAFFYPTPASLKNAQSHTLTVYYAGTATQVGNVTRTFTCSSVAQSLVLDVHTAAGTSGNLNGILEPGEHARVEPTWKNAASTARTLTGIASNLSGPQPATYSMYDTTASYGSVAPGASSSCNSTGDCYILGVALNGPRPVTHWDATFVDTLNSSATEYKSWTVHVGSSFTDVSQSSVYYSGIETVFHFGITAGCNSGTTYCPTTSIPRDQMAVFVVKAKYGAAYIPPPAIGIFADVPPGSFAADYIEQLYRDGITVGCGGGNYCPNGPSGTTKRSQMAVFLLKAKNGSGYTPPACTGIFPDVPCPSTYANWIEALQNSYGIAPGYCGSGKYCPDDATTREQMATFITKTFGLSLYGP